MAVKIHTTTVPNKSLKISINPNKKIPRDIERP
jgi:hypothetical protein